MNIDMGPTSSNGSFFTYVCHAWRTVALKHASLRTTPDLSTSDLAYAMIQRSGNAPLRVVITEGLHVKPGALQMIQVGSDRCSVLRNFVNSLIDSLERQMVCGQKFGMLSLQGLQSNNERACWGGMLGSRTESSRIV